MPKIKRKLETVEDRAVWAAAYRAAHEVAQWPAWKRGESSAPGQDPNRKVISPWAQVENLNGDGI